MGGKKKPPQKARLFYPGWTEAERRELLVRLVLAIGDSNMPLWAKGAAERALMDFGAVVRSPPRKGRPATAKYTHNRAALARAWFEQHYKTLKWKQYKHIIVLVLDVAPRALTGVTKAAAAKVSDRLPAWQATIEGAATIARLDEQARLLVSQPRAR
jgi:hypothetical protein